MKLLRIIFFLNVILSVFGKLFCQQDVIYRKFSDLNPVSLECSKDRLKIYIFFSKTHDVFLRRYFLPTLSKIESDYELNIYQVEQLTAAGQFLSAGWNAAMLKKNEMILEAIHRNYGQAILYADVDIQFLQPIKASLYQVLADYDLVVQRNAPSGMEGACAGFVFLRCNAKTFDLYQKIRLAMIADGTLRDQIALNKFLPLVQNLKWRYLPESEYFCPRRVWKEGSPLMVTSAIRVHHANWTEGVNSKLAQLDYVKNRFLALISKIDSK